jgi:hypothetical protein
VLGLQRHYFPSILPPSIWDRLKRCVLRLHRACRCYCPALRYLVTRCELPFSPLAGLYRLDFPSWRRLPSTFPQLYCSFSQQLLSTAHGYLSMWTSTREPCIPLLPFSMDHSSASAMVLKMQSRHRTRVCGHLYHRITHLLPM